MALLGSPVLVYGGGNAFTGGVDLGGCVGFGRVLGRDFSGMDRGVVGAGGWLYWTSQEKADASAFASAPGTKPGAFAEASAASIFPTLPRGDCFGLVVGYGCDLDVCGRLLERMVPASVTGFILCWICGGKCKISTPEA